MSDSDELTPRRYGGAAIPTPPRNPGNVQGTPVVVRSGQVGTSSDWAENKATIFDGPGYHLQDRLDTLQTSTDGLTTDVSTINGEISTINGEINGLIGEGGSVPTLQDDVATLQGNITTLNGEVATLQTDVIPLTMPEITYINDACAKLGITPAQAQWFFKNWSNIQTGSFASGDKVAGYYMTFNGSAIYSLATDLGPGSILRLSTGATANSGLQCHGTAFWPRLDTGKGYWRGRLKFETAIDAQSNIGWYLYDATGGAHSMGITVIGALSTANILFQYDGNVGGSSIPLIPVDTAWHEYEIWWKGDGLVHIAVDGNEIGVGVTPTQFTTLHMKTFLYIQNGTTAADRRLDSKYEFGLTTVD